MSRGVCSSVLIRVIGPDPSATKTEERPFAISFDGRTAFTASGFLLDPKNKIIITTATFLAPFLKNELEVLPTTSVQACFEETANHGKPIWRQLKLLEVIQVPLWSDSLEALLGGLHSWNFGWVSQKISTKSFSYFTSIAVLQLEEDSIPDNILPCNLRNKNTLQKGETIRVIGSPYCVYSPEIFMNTITEGVISNIFKLNEASPTVVITDNRCQPGMEGGPVVDSNSSIIGMLLPSIRKLDGTPVEFQFILCISDLLALLRKYLSFSEQNGKPVVPYVPVSIEQSVVLLEVENSWASGIIVSSDGHIVTNAHLIRPYLSPKLLKSFHYRPNVNISIRATIKGKSYPCNLIWISTSYLDVALLQLVSSDKSKFTPVLMNKNTSYTQGEPVIVIGYAVFKPSNYLGATWTSGIISKIVYNRGSPVIVQASAAIHSGNSGGLLVSSNGSWLGLVTCNIKRRLHTTPQDEDSSIITRLNFSIASSLLIPSISSYIASGDPSFLKKLDVNDPEVEALWKLQLNSEQLQQDIKNVQVQDRGNKFAAFMKGYKPTSKL